MIEEIICRDWLDVQEQLFASSWDDQLERYRSPYAFRGQFNREFALATTLQRMGGAFETLETHMLRAFVKYAHEQVAASRPGVVLGATGNSLWHWLVLARHHGLPTRLLDWSYSPYVALHFATEELGLPLPLTDGVVWCVNYREAHAHLPCWIGDVLAHEIADVFTIDILHRVAPDLITFDQMAQTQRQQDESEIFAFFFEPPSLDGRVINQFSLLSMMSNPKAEMDHWLADSPVPCRKLILPARIKWEIRDKLDQANINERLLYPGLDGLSRWLRRYYGPRITEKSV